MKKHKCITLAKGKEDDFCWYINTWVDRKGHLRTRYSIEIISLEENREWQKENRTKHREMNRK